MIIGHERQRQYLNRVLQRGRMPHAYLFYGPDAVGKLTVAKYFAKALYCDTLHGAPALEKACDGCVSCRLIDAYSHLDVMMIDRAHGLVSKKTERSEISIEDIRELRKRCALASPGNTWRIIIIDEVERLSHDAADAFLKLLEEPGKRTLFFLVGAGRELVPETIFSRTQAIGFTLVAERLLKEFLAKESKDSSSERELLGLAGGRPGVLLRLLRERAFFERTRKIRQEIAGVVSRRDIAELLRWSAQAAVDGEEARGTAEFLFAAVRERLLKESILGNDTGVFLKKLKRMHEIAALRETTNVNPRLALDALLLEAVVS